MIKILQKFYYLFLLVFLPGTALAQSDLENARINLQRLDMSVASGATPDAALQVMAESFLDKLPYILTVLAFASLLFSGGMYVLAMGDATKMEQAKKNIMWTVYGMIAMSLVLVGIRIVTTIASQTTRFPSFPNL